MILMIIRYTPTTTATGTATPITNLSTATPTLEPFAANEIFYVFLPIINQAADTPTPTPTFTPAPTPTATPTLTPTPPPPPETLLFCDNLTSSMFIPDNNPTGISNQISIADPRQVVHLSVYVDISHTWVSDLTVILSNLSYW